MLFAICIYLLRVYESPTQFPSLMMFVS